MFRIINIGTLSGNKFWGETTRVRTDIHATCTLLEVDGYKLLVDPSPEPADLRKLLFARAGITPEAIDLVYLTHFHADHRMGLSLFPHAQWLIAGAELETWAAQKNGSDAPLIERFHPAEGRLPDSIELYPAPGHTLTLHALKLPTQWGDLIVAGDAVMNREFFAASEGFRNSVDFELATQTIQRIKRDAALVIPGHDNVIINIKVKD